MTTPRSALPGTSPAALVTRRNLGVGDPILLWTVRFLSIAALAAVVLMLADTIGRSAELLKATSVWTS